MLLMRLIVVTALVIFTNSISAVQPQTGPVIEAYGPVFSVPEDVFKLKKDTHYKVTMDVSASVDNPQDLNRHFESAARFLNMHARNGVGPENIDFAIVVHGAAAKDLLNDDAYKARFEESNPNTALLNALGEAGVKIYLCGQSAAYREIKTQDLNPAAEMALSAMSAHVRLQSEGYTLIPF
jgi:intracellular sulfur oxidation DsrE/DsrF family protein